MTSTFSFLEFGNRKIAVISPSTVKSPAVYAIIGLAEEDINAYLNRIWSLSTIRILLDDAQGEPSIHLEKIQSFKSQGIDLIIGGASDAQLDGSYDYLEANNMLLISPSSRQTAYATPGDNIFRLSTNNSQQGNVIAEMLDSFGIRAIIVIQRDDPWADEIYNTTKQAFESKNGTIIDRIRYSTDPLGRITNLGTCLRQAEANALEAVQQYDKSQVAVLVISLNEVVDIVKNAKDYSTLYSIYWFSSDGKDMSWDPILKDYPEEASHLKVFSPRLAPAISQNYTSLNERFYNLTNQNLDFYMANWYDAAWLYAKALLKTGYEDTEAVKDSISQVAGEHFGASGYCKLNEAGDRMYADYDIWGFGYVEGKPDYVKYGIYDGQVNRVIWFTDKLGFSPPE